MCAELLLTLILTLCWMLQPVWSSVGSEEHMVCNTHESSLAVLAMAT